MDDLTKTDDAKTAAGTEGGKDRSLDDLKAKLGIAKKPKAEKPITTQMPVVPKAPSATDFAFTLNQPGAGQADVEPEETSEVRRLLAGRKKLGIGTIGAYAGAAVVVLLLGLYFGKVMKERSIENLKSKEADYVLKYLTTAKPGAPGIDESVMSIVEKHIDDATAVYQSLQKAATDEARLKAEADLMAFLKRCQQFREKKALLTFDGAFPGVIQNQELAAQVVQLIYALQKVYDETAIIGLEADTLDRVKGLEERDGMMQTFLVEPTEEDGKKMLSFRWIAKIDTDNPRDAANGKEYVMIPLGGQQAFWAPEKSLVQFDLKPLAEMKSKRYEQAILTRVQGRLALIKAAGEQVVFKPMKDKLEKVATRPDLFTVF
jgi:hypothetical protein